MPTYAVTWRVEGMRNPHVTDVKIIPGYTTEHDIPRIIAVSRTGRADDALYIQVIDRTKISDD